MMKGFTRLAVAAALSIPAASMAFAHDRIDDGDRHIARDHARIESDARKVHEEAAELSQARRQLRWSLWSGDPWRVRRAQARVLEEEHELAAARRKFGHDVQDVRRDRAAAWERWEHRRHWWW